MGDVHTNEETQPKIIPELQNRSVISIVLGDYHYGALTADGQLLTWGEYSQGALGLGMPTDLPLGAPGGYLTESQLIQSKRSQWGPLEPPRVPSPSLVHFNHGPSPGGRRFCFAATASGWHMGALVVCLEVRISFNAHEMVLLTCDFSSPRKKYMTPVLRLTKRTSLYLGLDCHLAVGISHPYPQTLPRSDLAAEYSGLDMQGVGVGVGRDGLHRRYRKKSRSVCIVLYKKVTSPFCMCIPI